MSTSPSAPPPTQGYERPYYGSGMPPVPLPSIELIVFLLVWFVVGLVTLLADGREGVSPPQFVTASVALAVGFMIARGLAKLGKVIEGE
ncbi:MAG: hypothetical protein M3377_00165 [Actinomycetota bacterium]|nr:hypothetical protein [Actinomycetota bacterium]